MAGEFELIARHFVTPVAHTDLGVGDDAALMRVRPGMQLLVSSDMLVEGTHFLPEVDPFLLGWKTAAVNISDLAAMGAEPRWITLALSLPRADEAWVAALAKGFHACCHDYAVDWVGGDTTRGPLNLCATILGEVPQGEAIRRDGASPGDDIWVSGEPGLAALGLAALLEGLDLGADRERCLMRLHKPTPRVALGCALRGVASAMLDVSDGVLGDLRHILERSKVGAVLEESALPLQFLVQACQNPQRALKAFLSGGDDYELLFTAPTERAAQVRALARQVGVTVTPIGQIQAEPGVCLHQADGSQRVLEAGGYDHFAA